MEELYENIWMSRRRFIIGVGVGVCAEQAGAGAIIPSDSRDQSTARHCACEGAILWDDFTRRTLAAARALVREKTPDELLYLDQIGLWLSCATGVPEATFYAPDARLATATMFESYPLDIIQIQMGPGSVMPHHDHREYNGLLEVVSGGVCVTNFEIVDSAAAATPGASFLIRETRRENLGPRQKSRVSRTIDNIHCLQAGPAGARIMDCLTYFQTNGRSHYLEVDQRPRSSSLEMEARWIE